MTFQKNQFPHNKELTLEEEFGTEKTINIRNKNELYYSKNNLPYAFVGHNNFFIDRKKPDFIYNINEENVLKNINNKVTEDYVLSNLNKG